MLAAKLIDQLTVFPVNNKNNFSKLSISLKRLTSQHRVTKLNLSYLLKATICEDLSLSSPGASLSKNVTAFWRSKQHKKCVVIAQC